MSEQIFVVEGSTGEYSDSRDWLICAYWEEARAQQHVVAAQARANELIATHISGYYDIPPGANEHDPDMTVDYTGVRYTYYPVELR